MFSENKTTELKREYVDDIKNTAIAFANCDGGTLYVGIEDDGTVRGVEDGRHHAPGHQRHPGRRAPGSDDVPGLPL